jgi:MYXO-CTERM domain-containing protein
MRGNATWIRPWSALIAAAALAPAASASLLSFESIAGTEGLGAYHGTMEWICPKKDDSECGTLLVTLTNDSPVGNGGFLTGFAFNVIDGLTLTYQPDSESLGQGWQHIFNVSAPPFGMFDYGAALGGNWLGGGSPENGIAVGDTKVFAFEVCGSPEFLCSVDVFDFFDESGGYGLVARFKGFDDGGSDKVPAVTPGPGALALAVIAGIAGRRRSR